MIFFRNCHGGTICTGKSVAEHGIRGQFEITGGYLAWLKRLVIIRATDMDSIAHALNEPIQVPRLLACWVVCSPGVTPSLNGGVILLTESAYKPTPMAHSGECCWLGRHSALLL